MSRAQRIAIIILWGLTATMGQAQTPRTLTTVTAKA